MSSNAQLRKIKKPLIERRRRERINECLTQLKTLVLEAMNKDESRYSKMEKADILEMTVSHLRAVQHQLSSTASVCNPSISLTSKSCRGQYLMGYNECSHAVRQYLTSSVEEELDNANSFNMRQLSSCKRPPLPEEVCTSERHHLVLSSSDKEFVEPVSRSSRLEIASQPAPNTDKVGTIATSHFPVITCSEKVESLAAADDNACDGRSQMYTVCNADSTSQVSSSRNKSIKTVEKDCNEITRPNVVCNNDSKGPREGFPSCQQQLLLIDPFKSCDLLLLDINQNSLRCSTEAARSLTIPVNRCALANRPTLANSVDFNRISPRTVLSPFGESLPTLSAFIVTNVKTDVWRPW